MEELLDRKAVKTRNRFFSLKNRTAISIAAALVLLLIFAVWESPWEKRVRLKNAARHMAEAMKVYSSGSPTSSQCGKEAIKHIRMAIELDRNNIKYREREAIIYFQCSDYDKAASTFERVVEKNPSPDNLFYLARALIRKKDPDRERAIGFLSQVVELRPDFTGGHQMLGDLRASLGMLKEAIKDWRKTISLLPEEDPFRAEFHNRIADAYMKLGERDLAFNEWSATLKVDPNNGPAKKGLGIF